MTTRRSRELDDDAFRRLLIDAGRKERSVLPGAEERALAEVVRRLPLLGISFRSFPRAAMSLACGALAAAAFAVSLRSAPASLSAGPHGAGGIGTSVGAKAPDVRAAGRETMDGGSSLARSVRINDVGAGLF